MRDDPEKKIIVDEDWKSRVTAEREAAEKKSTEAPSQGEPPADDAASTPEFPPASFEMLITALATEAMMGMGQIPHPGTGEGQANHSQARYAIDMLEVLQTKTKGNLDTQEETALRDILHQLRMAFIATQSQSPAAPPPPPA